MCNVKSGWVISLVCAVWVVCASAAAAQTPVKGWPRKLGDLIQNSPCLADLDGDGRQEIIQVSSEGLLYIWNSDGTAYSVNGNSFPRPLGFVDGTVSSVAVGDVTGDGNVDLVVGGDDLSAKLAKLLVYDLNSMTSTTLSLPSNTNASFKSTVALVDCAGTASGQEIVLRDGDGQLFIYSFNGSAFTQHGVWQIVGSDNTQRDRYANMPITPSPAAYKTTDTITFVAAPSTDGKLYVKKIVSDPPTTNWQVIEAAGSDVGDWFLGSPAIGYLDADNRLDVIVGNNNETLYAFEIEDNGSTIGVSQKWAVSVDGWAISSPAVGDVDYDGDLEVVIGTDGGKIYVIEADGTQAAYSPLSTQGDVFASPVLAEIDRVGGLEIVATSLDGRVYIWSGTNGQLLPDWPKKLLEPIYASPAVADLNGDGRMQLLATTFAGLVCQWEFPLKSLTTDGWLQFRGGARRTGSFE